MTEIDGQDIHFVHVRSARPEATPLLLLHGWPVSFLEFLDVIEPLADAGHHVVVPSAPGFGFSTPISSPGWTPGRIAAAYVELMARLGYERYGVHGCDTGSFIAPEMGHLAPQRIIGIHLSGMVTFPAGEEVELSGVDAERAAAMASFNDGYLQIQSKSPQTLAYGLHDSPVAQAAWIAEAFHNWAGTPVDRDRLLTNISLYWFTGTGGSAGQIYYESMNDPAAWEPKGRGTVPTGVLLAAVNEVAVRPYAERDHHIVHWSQQERGGHFFAMEEPQLFADDLKTFFGKLS